ncbi:hypothetical protein C824_000484 [Schaedlerella arabinosiphila]|nr:hypothetical protein C824_000484 [Schaedlerella arabinosiphila]
MTIVKDARKKAASFFDAIVCRLEKRSQKHDEKFNCAG